MKGRSRLGPCLALLLASPACVRAQEDIVVYGGTSGGVAAAVQAARMGKRVVLIEPGRHLGGLTSGGLGATDFGKPDAVGGLAREFYRRVKKHYTDPAAWKWEKAADYRSHRHDPDSDAMWHFEPHVAEKIFNDLVRETGVRVVFAERLDLNAGVTQQDSRITSIRMDSGSRFTAKMFIDATYEGDLMAKAGVSYHVGREANSVHGEMINGVQTKRLPYSGHNFSRPVSPYVVPGNPASGLLSGVQKEPPGVEGGGDRRVQAYCFRLCMTEVEANRVPFSKPAGYDDGCYELLLRYLTSTGSFADHPNPRPVEHPALGYRPYIVIMPNRKTDSNTKGAISGNLIGGNYDYPDGDYATRERIIAEHTRWQQGLLWFLQNDPRVPAAYREPMQTWGLAKDEFTDNHHWPHQLYVREARRMIGAYVMTEHDCAGTRAADDSAGLGSYGMDSHVTQRYVDAQGWVRNEGTLGGRVPHPYPISYRALTPKPGQCENLLVPVCCSASHAAYGSIRMEPVFMILGQSAATAACLAIDDNVSVQKVDYARLRQRLLKDGQVLEWPAAKSAALREGIWMSRGELAALPMDGPAWEALLQAANKSCGRPDLSDQDQMNNVLVLAKALVFARTGAEKYRTEVRAQCRAVMGTESGGRTLALGRELAAYVISADLVTLEPDEDARFRDWLRHCLNEKLDGNTLRATHEERPNNWGAHAGASRVAIAAYLDDRAELERAARVFRGWLGEREAYAGFDYGKDLSWHADASRPLGINPRGAVRKGRSIDGLIPDDMRRGGSVQFPPKHTGYPWGALEGAVLMAEILHRRGFDAWNWGDQALLRAAQALRNLHAEYPADGWWAHGDDVWIPWVLNRAYGAAFPTETPARPGKNMAWTDWTHAR